MYQKALAQFLKAAKQGDAHAQYMLGEYCTYRQNDKREAIKWYRKAAEHGDAEAQYKLVSSKVCNVALS